MKRRMGERIREELLSVLFILGILGGTVFSLWRSSLPEEGIRLSTALSARWKEEGIDLLLSRLRCLILGWLAGLTVCSRFVFGWIAFGTGFVLSFGLSCLTLEKGLWGIFLFLGKLLPEGLLYGLIWFVLAAWAWQREKRLHLPALAVLTMLLAAGVWAELFMRRMFGL